MYVSRNYHGQDLVSTVEVRIATFNGEGAIFIEEYPLLYG